MTKAEKFIKDYTNSCSNELISVQDRFHNEVISYREWLTPEQALRAVEIEREELLDKACDAYCKVCGHFPHSVPTHICRHDCSYFSDFKKYIKGE